MTFCSEFGSILIEELKYFFHLGSLSRLALVWGCSMEFLLIIIIPASWGAMFDLVIPS